MHPAPPDEARTPPRARAKSWIGPDGEHMDTKTYVRRLKEATKRRAPRLNKPLLIKGFLGLVGAALACAYSSYRIKASEDDFQAIQRARMKEVGSQVLGSIQRQLETSVSSTKALAALVPLDGGAILLNPLMAEVNELKAAAEAVASASEADKEAAAQRKSAAKSVVIVNSSKYKFNAVADSLIKTYKGISNLQLAPSGVVSAIHPIQTNEGAIGHDLFYDPNRRDGALRSITTGSTVFVGPLTLIQNGKTAIIARHPVFMSGNGFVGPLAQSPSWWGFATMLSLMEDLFAPTQLSSHERPESYILYAKVGDDARLLRACPGVPGQPEKVTDDPDKIWMKYAEEQDPIKLSFDDTSLNVHWELWLWPKNGWPKTGDTFEVQVVLCVLLTVSGLFSLYSLLLRESVIAEVSAMSADMPTRTMTSDLDAVVPVSLQQ